MKNKKPLLKHSAQPLYRQLATIIKENIGSGELKLGEQIMTETELSDFYQVSRITVRKGIELLVDEGILMKRPGIGTFVSEQKIQRNVSGILGFTANCEQMGKTSSAKLLAAELIPANVVDIETLKLKKNSNIIRILRLRLCDNVPVIIEENRFPQQYAFLLGEDLQGSLYSLLATRGIKMASGKMDIGICSLTEYEAQLLDSESAKPMLLTKVLVCDEDGNPIHYGKNIINMDRYKLTIIQ